MTGQYGCAVPPPMPSIVDCTHLSPLCLAEPELSFDTRGHSVPGLKVKRTYKPSNGLMHLGSPSGPVCGCEVLLGTYRTLALV